MEQKIKMLGARKLAHNNSLWALLIARLYIRAILIKKWGQAMIRQLARRLAVSR